MPASERPEARCGKRTGGQLAGLAPVVRPAALCLARA